ncbi:hypothetical protein EW146_g3215 [Bondarzewia mesenterica]|uniref:Clathrin/coatomer adaptor adaptin-like N-terminal domain-containing protein n=1 Tax=Bondarzewia mesenterica TaxID=1095465 RepID=A0A4S4M021_9AGAM|nr:hypothetical protein EW146_g3215 [Bondarzewia mesenterica]
MTIKRAKSVVATAVAGLRSRVSLPSSSLLQLLHDDIQNAMSPSHSCPSNVQPMTSMSVELPPDAVQQLEDSTRTNGGLRINLELSIHIGPSCTDNQGGTVNIKSTSGIQDSQGSTTTVLVSTSQQHHQTPHGQSETETTYDSDSATESDFSLESADGRQVIPLTTNNRRRLQRLEGLAYRPRRRPIPSPMEPTSRSSTPSSISSLDMGLSTIEAIEYTFRILKADCAFPSTLDFDSHKETLAFTPTNALVHLYEHALNKIAVKLDVGESDGDEEVRGWEKRASLKGTSAPVEASSQALLDILADDARSEQPSSIVAQSVKADAIPVDIPATTMPLCSHAVVPTAEVPTASPSEIVDITSVAVPNLKVRKLCYTEAESDLTFLSINTFQCDLTDSSPLIHAMALRVLSSIRVPTIDGIVMLAIKKCAADISSYVRKTAATSTTGTFDLVYIWID